MKLRTAAKVMNFSALLRVDSFRKKAAYYSAMEQELTDMMRIVLNSRNLQLSRLFRTPDSSLPALRIYIGSDFGVCGSVNSSVEAIRDLDAGSCCVVIGKKLRKNGEESLWLRHGELREKLPLIRQYLGKAVKEGCWSSVELVYNHYYNTGLMRTEIRRIFPLSPGDGKPKPGEHAADFLIEGDPEELLQGMMISCLVYELKIAEASACASENLMRRNSTSEALKRMQETEEEEEKRQHRERNTEAIRRTADSYIKRKSPQKGEHCG